MKTDKVVNFDKLQFKIFSLSYKSGTGLPQFIKNQQNYSTTIKLNIYNLRDKRTTKKPQDVLLRKKYLN